MKTVSSLFAAALSLTAAATTASAMPHIVTFDGLMAPEIATKLNPANSGAGFARAAAAGAAGSSVDDTTPPIVAVSDQVPQVQTTFKLASQSADIAVEKAKNSGSSDENIAAAACTSPDNSLIAVVIIAAVDADNCPKPQAATAIEYGLIAALIGGGPDATDTTTTTGEAEPQAATAIEYGLIAALTSNGPDVTETVYAESEFE